ncbi:MAG: outer membrane beta-barrel protein [Candidatus Acidiferrales bacterium]
MSLRKLIYLAIFVLALGVSSAQAQWSSSDNTGFWHRGVEITPFGGTRFGGVIDLSNTNAPTNVDYLTIRSTWDYGAMLDVDLFPHAQAEFMWNNQPTVLGAHVPGSGSSRLGEADLDMFQWGLLYEFLQPGSKFQPYAVGGVGFTSYNTNGIIDLGNELSFNVGGGVKYFFDPHFGVRVEARYSPSRTTEGEGLYCDPFYGCYPAQVSNYAHQGQANVGLIFRF